MTDLQLHDESHVIRTSAPTRFDFAGGPTDVAPFKTEEGGYVVNASLGIRVRVSVAMSDATSEIVVRSHDLGLMEHFSSIDVLDQKGDLRLVKAAIQHVHPEGGIRVTTNTDAPRGSGLGASASLAVALLSALHQTKGENPTAQELAEEALYVENVIIGNINGGQDQYAAALGGFHALEFGSEHVDVIPLQLGPGSIQSLEERSVLCYSGEAHLSGRVLDRVMADYKCGDRRTVMALRSMKRIAQESVQALTEGAFEDLGGLIKAAGETQRDCHPSVTPPTVERLFQIGWSHGALGAKMAGAGGGGCVYFFCAPERKQELHDALVADGVRVLPVQFLRSGLMTAEKGLEGE